MERIAFISGESFYYWSTILTVLGAACAACLFWSLCLRGGEAMAAAVAVPIAAGLSVVLARLIHWYCRTNSYESFSAAMTPGAPGGYALMGVFAGCILAAVLVRLLKLTRDLPRMLDRLCVSGSAGIAVGRLASFYNTSDRGGVLADSVPMPWAYPVTNPVSGVVENRLATFLIQAMFAAAILLVLSLLSLRKKKRSGDATLVFLLLYGASQVVLDSTRYDSLYLRSNGFISVVQILGAASIVLSAVVYSIWLVKNHGMKPFYGGLWLALLALTAGAGYMEYYVQRHGSEAAFAYSVMSVCLAGYAAVTLLIRFLALRKKRYIGKRLRV